MIDAKIYTAAIMAVSVGIRSSIKNIWIFSKNFLPPAIFCSRICKKGLVMTIRETIHKELQRRGWSRYRLEKQLEGKIPARTVYAYLIEECDLGSDRVSIILQALDLTITTKSKKTRRQKMDEKTISKGR